MKNKKLNINTEITGRVLFLILFVLYIGYFILGEIFLPNETFTPDEYDDYQNLGLTWTVLEGGPTKETVTLPHFFDVKEGERIVLESTLPNEVLTGKYLMFWTQAHDFVILVDGEVRLTYDTSDSRILGPSSPTAYLFCRLNYEDAGKTIRVEAIGRDSSAGDIREFIIGEKFPLMIKLLRPNQVEVFFGLILICLSLLCTIVSFIMEVYLKKPLKLIYLSLGVFIASIWMVTNSPIKQLFIPNISVSRDITFFSVGLLAIPFLIYLNEIQDRHYKMLYFWIEVFDFVLLSVTSSLYVFGNMPIKNLFPAYALTCVVSISVLFATMITDICKKRIRPYIFSAIGFLTLCTFAIFEIVFFITKTGTIFTGSFVIIGMFFLLIFAIIDMVQDVIDISKEREAALLATKAQAKFLANMSHEIRTPINAILGMDEIILREEKNADIKAYAQDIKDAGTGLLTIINDILDYSKIESGQLEIIPAEYRLTDILTACGNIIRPRIEANDLAFSIKVAPDTPSVLYGDEVRIRQILLNLLSNAAKYTRVGSVTLQVEHNEKDAGKTTLTFSVIDTGMGIKNEDKDKLFKSFKRLELNRNRSIEGTGLGLAITNELTSLMNGTIGFESVYGVGSTFTVNIPQKVIDATPIGTYTYGTATHVTDTKADKHILKVADTKVLVVDDVAVNLRVFAKLLEGTGIKVDTAISGMKALELCEKNCYDMIFLDHMMPDMDGIETFERLNDEKYVLNHNIPVIMVTANALAEAMQEYLSMGFTDYVSKPISLTALEEVIQKHLPAEKIVK